jgi:hypothetical protein
MKLTSNKDLRRILEAAVGRGWRIVTPNKPRKSRRHVAFEWVDGQRIIVSLSPSDHRALKNIQATFKRAERRTLQ